MYVGMTRGRHRNTLHVVATDLDDAREQFTTALRRDRADRGLTAATRAARQVVDGLVPAGPVAFVNAERARLREWIQSADHEAARWEQALGAFRQQSAEHHGEYERQAEVAAAADARVVQVRAEAAAPLVEQASADVTEFLAAQERTWQANRALDATGRFGRRAAARTAREATEARYTARDVVTRRWGEAPQMLTNVTAWAEFVAGQGADSDPRVIHAQQDAARAHQQLHNLAARHADQRAELQRSIGDWPRSIEARATDLRRGLEQARRTLTEIEALPAPDGAQLIRDLAAQAEAARTARAARRARAAERNRWPSPSPEYGPSLERDFGPSL